LHKVRLALEHLFNAALYDDLSPSYNTYLCATEDPNSQQATDASSIKGLAHVIGSVLIERINFMALL
jgi:hypothetical protein